IVGAINDPIFGKTTASVYSSMILSSFNFNYGSTATADSIVLCLALKTFYGDTTTPIHFKVYRLDSVLPKDTVYYSNSTLSASTLIGDAIVTVKPSDSITEYAVKRSAHIRIPLFTNLATELISKSGGPEYVDNTAFANYFKGIYITAEPEAAVDKGCLYQWDYKSALSRMTVYYKLNTDSDSLAYSYNFDELLRFNNYQHNYTGTEVGNALTFPTVGQNNLYVRAMAGTKAFIQFPTLKSIIDERAFSVNNAILVFKAEPNTKYTPNANLTLALVDSAGNQASFAPDNNELANAADGTYNSSTNEYKFNITRYVNRILAEKHVDYGIYLRSASSIINFNRVKLNGTGNVTGRLKLELTYSKY
ncbi:MAG TPA: DUF4270 family protein, partial [Bacteroidia bacterium]|nr:DUF4270 family protein [Bacteroidia bacterium]